MVSEGCPELAVPLAYHPSCPQQMDPFTHPASPQSLSLKHRSWQCSHLSWCQQGGESLASG